MSFWAASIKPDAPCAYHAPPGCVLTIRTAALEEGSPPARLWLKTRGQRGEEVTALLGVLRPWGASETLKLDHSAGFGSEALALLVSAADEAPSAGKPKYRLALPAVTLTGYVHRVAALEMAAPALEDEDEDSEEEDSEEEDEGEYDDDESDDDEDDDGEAQHPAPLKALKPADDEEDEEDEECVVRARVPLRCCW